jgi:cell division protein FtsB
MATANTKAILEKIALLLGLATILGGAVSTWAVAQYRIEKLEAKNEELEKELKLLRDEFHAQGERVKCLICKAHDMECPGC